MYGGGRPLGTCEGAPIFVMTDTQIEVVCDEALSCALLPLARRSLEPLLSSMCRKALALHKEGLLPEVPKGVVLALVTDREMAGLNRSAMGVPGPTNILSFPDGKGTAELALDVAQLLREAVLYGQTPVDHMVRLLAHGLAHVCGLDHGEHMWRCQEEIESAGKELLSGLRAAG